jgi:uncharacterized protein DUF4383
MLAGQPIGPKRERGLVFYVRLVGGIYLTLAILGLLMTGLTPFAPAEGDTLLVFSVNPLTNLIHLLVGLVAVPAAERLKMAQRLALWLGALMVVWAVLGFALDGSTADIFATNVEIALLHLATGLVGVGLAVGVPRRSPAAGTA